MKPFFKCGLVAALCHLYDTQAKPQYQTHSGIILEQTAGEITSFSSLGASIISSSRRLSSSDRILAEDDDEDQDDEQEEEEEDYLWLQNYALKFQGCQHIKQWNPDVDEEDDVELKLNGWYASVCALLPHVRLAVRWDVLKVMVTTWWIWPFMSAHTERL